MTNKTARYIARKYDTNFEKTAIADIGGAIYGAARAGALSKEEKEKLTEYHRMSPDSMLKTRNAGRGFLGAMGGAALGAIPGAMTGNKGMAIATALLGAGGGAHLATNKYSRNSHVLK